MSAYQKFDFSPIHDPNGDFTPIKRKKVLNEQDLNIARNEGFKEGEVSQIAISQKQAAESLRAIASMMQMILGKLNTESKQLREDAVEVSMAAAKAIAGAALEKCGKETILDYIKEATANLRNVPRIIIKVPHDLISAVEEPIYTTARDTGFDGQIEVRGDDNARLGDCSIEWQDGSISYNHDETIEKIEAAANSWLKSAEQTEVQLNLFDTI